MKRLILAIIAVNLVGIVVLAFVYPDAMLAPGKLIPAHVSLENDCFACHAPLQGAVEARCTTCHAVADIGLLTVAGAPIVRATPKAPFHQGLGDTDCMSCHTDHPKASLTTAHSHSFDHGMLLPTVGAACSSCHTPPADAIHVAPTAQCSTCHVQTNWAAAAIDHTRFFALTGPHDVACASCHTTPGDFKRYTCFSCHEHQEASLIREHLEEGIRNIDNCVACHRDAHGEGGEGREGHERGKDDD
mgnify:CR=1 FL=1|jgi:hypothetical protein